MYVLNDYSETNNEDEYITSKKAIAIEGSAYRAGMFTAEDFGCVMGEKK